MLPAIRDDLQIQAKSGTRLDVKLAVYMPVVPGWFFHHPRMGIRKSDPSYHNVITLNERTASLLCCFTLVNIMGRLVVGEEGYRHFSGI